MRSLPSLLLTGALAGALVGCDSDNVCEQAITKINACRTATAPDAGLTEPLMKFAGDCNDAVLIGSGEAISFKSWSDRYVPCAIDPATCLCPDLPWFDQFDPPDSITTPTPR